MPALINNRLAVAFDELPPESRHAPELALAAYGVMEGAALALGLPSTGVAFYKPGAFPEALPFSYVVSWPDGPDDWAGAAAADLMDRLNAPHARVYTLASSDVLCFEGVVA